MHRWLMNPAVRPDSRGLGVAPERTRVAPGCTVEGWDITSSMHRSHLCDHSHPARQILASLIKQKLRFGLSETGHFHNHLFVSSLARIKCGAFLEGGTVFDPPPLLHCSP